MMLRAAFAAGAVALASATAPAWAGYAVTNPYAASQTSYNQVKIRRLVVFGDSYSDPAWLVEDNWNEQLVAAGTARFQSNYAVAGATALNGPTNGQPTNSLRQQVDRFLGAGISYAPQDLTVVYIGYNDINRVDGLGASKNDYTKNVDRLRLKGATNQNRRMMLVMEHNMLRDPGKANRANWNLATWNQHVASVANGRSNVIAVDLYTAFERVYANPGRYGFVNVKTPDPTRTAVDALYYDSRHFGLRGQRLIQQVFRHYLSRGWDWANTLKTGGQTVAALNRDLDDGLVFDTYALDDAQTALAVIPFGQLASAGGAWEETRPDDGGPRMGFVPGKAGAPDGGAALALRAGAQTRLALVIGDYDARSGGATAIGSGETTASSRASGLVLDHRAGRLSLRSSVLYADDRYTTRSYDDFVGEGTSTDFDGSTLRVGQKVGWDLEAGPLLLTSWAELSYSRQETDGFGMADPFVSDLSYDAAAVAETSAAIGLSMNLLPLDLGGFGKLRLKADIGYTHGLAADDYRLSVKEAAVAGYTQRETVANTPDRSLQLGLAAGWEVAPAIAVTAGYGLDAPLQGQDGRKAEHRLAAGVAFRF